MSARCVCVDLGERCPYEANGPDGLCWNCRSYDCVNAVARTIRRSRSCDRCVTHD